VIYFLLTRLYFRHLAIGLFDPERCGRVTESLLQACGGLPNVRSVSASYHRLTLSLYDPSLLDRKTLADLSIETLVETKDAFVLPIGAEAWMIRQDIYQRMRRYIRDVDEN
jgi:phosphotransferase system IIB component